MMPMMTVAPRKSVAPCPLALLDRREGQDHRHRRADQDEGVERGEVDGQGIGQLVVGLGPVVGHQRLDLGLGAEGVRAGRAGLRPSPCVSRLTTDALVASSTVSSCSLLGARARATAALMASSTCGGFDPIRLEQHAVRVLDVRRGRWWASRGCCRRWRGFPTGGRCRSRSAR